MIGFNDVFSDLCERQVTFVTKYVAARATGKSHGFASGKQTTGTGFTRDHVKEGKVIYCLSAARGIAITVI